MDGQLVPSLQVALAQIAPKKADYAENLGRIGAVLTQVAAWDEPAELVIFGEAALSGYFVEGGVRDVAVSGGTLFRDLMAQHEAVSAPPMDICVGFYETYQNRIFNSALYATLGGADAGIRHIHRKVFLPTYAVFDEERFVDAGQTIQAFDTKWGRAAMLICEDVWHSASATVAALDGAQFIIVPAAAPARGVNPSESDTVNSTESWDRIIRRVAAEHGVYLALVQLVGFEGGKGLQGRSTLVGPDGAIIASAPVFDQAVIRARLEDNALLRARVDQPLLADLETALPNLLRGIAYDGSLRPPLAHDDADGDVPDVSVPDASKHAVIEPGATSDPLGINPELVEQWLVRFLREEVAVRCGFTKGIVGLSGGVDSAVTAALAVRALGAENVIAVRLPYKTSAPDSKEHAELIAKHLGIELKTIDITEAVDGFYNAAQDNPDPTRRGNVMARSRMIALFDLSAKHNALPLGTGNKTERLLGYFTWHADDSPPVNPLGDLFKTQIWELARYLGIPSQVVEKPATADLVEGQTDEADLGISYAKADVILHWLLTGLKPREIVGLGFTLDEVDRVKRRLDSTHWKRRLPTVAMVSGAAIGESYLRPVDF
jgi:NAD+ synthetase